MLLRYLTWETGRIELPFTEKERTMGGTRWGLEVGSLVCKHSTLDI